MPFAELERAVLAMLFAGDHPALAVLRAQLARATVARRELTGVGFFTAIRVAPDAPRLDGPRSIRFGDVEATLAGLVHDAGFVAFINDGALAMLEGHSYDEPWPTDVEHSVLRYHEVPRDLSLLAFAGHVPPG